MKGNALYDRKTTVPCGLWFFFCNMANLPRIRLTTALYFGMGKEEGTMMFCRYQAYKFWAALFFAGALASFAMK